MSLLKIYEISNKILNIKIITACLVSNNTMTKGIPIHINILYFTRSRFFFVYKMFVCKRLLYKIVQFE